MLLTRSYRRRSSRFRRSWFRLAIFLLGAILCLDFHQTVGFGPAASPARRATSSRAVPNERIFIASMNWQNEPIIRSHWGAAMLDLVRAYGAENLYISIQASRSFDNTVEALQDLDAELELLGVERSIVLDETTHEMEANRTPAINEEGWIWTSEQRRELRRIPYLAGIRNKVMSKLYALAERPEGARKFDKILWLNDVIFTTDDVTTLLATRDGNYAAACSLDFKDPPIYYDTFALRDSSGAKAATLTWPFFLSRESRKALMANAPVPVRSCWNGIVVFQAEPFYSSRLRFRGVPDSLAAHHIEGSECCLIHADNPLTATKGVWLNPNVRVSYNPEADRIVNPETGVWPGKGGKFWGIWGNRLKRLSTALTAGTENYIVGRRLRLWQTEAIAKGFAEFQEKGTFCLVNEMQILMWNGWKHM